MEDVEAPPASEDVEFCPYQKLYEDAGTRRYYCTWCVLLSCVITTAMFLCSVWKWSHCYNFPIQHHCLLKALISVWKLHDKQCSSMYSQFHILQQNPICNKADVEFLTKEVARIQDIFISAQQQQQETSELMLSTVSTGWGQHWHDQMLSLPFSLLLDCIPPEVGAHFLCNFSKPPPALNAGLWLQICDVLQCLQYPPFEHRLGWGLSWHVWDPPNLMKVFSNLSLCSSAGLAVPIALLVTDPLSAHKKALPSCIGTIISVVALCKDVLFYYVRMISHDCSVVV